MVRLPDRDLLDTRMAKALSHPVRVQILSALNTGESSPSEIARAIDVPVVNVSHHIQVLLKLEVIEQVAVRHVRGALEHRYRAVPQKTLSSEHFAELPAAAVRGVVTEAAQVVISSLVGTVSSDQFYERDDNHISFTPLELDAEGWSKVYALLLEALDQALAEQDASRARVAEGAADGPLQRASLSILLYEAAPSESTDLDGS